MSKKKKDNVPEWHGTFQHLAEELANVRYDRIAQFFDAMAKEISNQNDPDNWELTARLRVATQHLEMVSLDFKTAQKIILK